MPATGLVVVSSPDAIVVVEPVVGAEVVPGTGVSEPVVATTVVVETVVVSTFQTSSTI